MARQDKKKVTEMNQGLNSVWNKITKLSVFILFLSVFISPKFSLGASGEEIYSKMCMSCHSLTDKVLMGPGFQGLSERRKEEWIIKWVKDSQGMIKEGDVDAVKLFEEYNKVPMPGFPNLTDQEIKDFIAYTKAQEAAPAAAAGGSGSASTTAATATETPGVNLNLDLVFWTLLSLIIVGFFLYRFKKKTFEQVNQVGYHSEPHSIPNYGLYFIIFLIAAAAIVFVLATLLTQNIGMINSLMFLVLPYVAFGIFIIGSIYRYTQRGYQVSSLSSQFLEGKKLFWGSQPFHWGLLVLFTGHLIAFLFPSALLAWNGQPLRLLILEVSSFAFGLSALLGLILLIKRRLETKMLLVVTNKMDMLVYTVLFTQVLSGLGVAFFVRWGSSWFASTLTPYLRSIFSFNPDIEAISAMPWLIKIHVISAFLIIAIIPFTRFMHFLVAPFDYIWRKYQVVIWNWNPRNIRVSSRHFFGKKSRNH
jgi:nitrate reductase gamma subunit